METTIVGAIASLFSGKSTPKSRLEAVDKTYAELEADERNTAASLAAMKQDFDEEGAAALLAGRRDWSPDPALLDRCQKRLDVLALAKGGLLKERAKIEKEMQDEAVTTLVQTVTGIHKTLQDRITLGFALLGAGARALRRAGYPIDLRLLPSAVQAVANVAVEDIPALDAAERGFASLGLEPTSIVASALSGDRLRRTKLPDDLADRVARDAPTIEAQHAKKLGLDLAALDKRAQEAADAAARLAESNAQAKADARAAWIEACAAFALRLVKEGVADEATYRAGATAVDYLYKASRPTDRLCAALERFRATRQASGNPIEEGRRDPAGLATALGLPLVQL